MDYFAAGLFREQDHDIRRELSNREQDRIWKHIDRRRLSLTAKMIKHIRKQRAELGTLAAKRTRYILRNWDCPDTARFIWNRFHPESQIEEEDICTSTK